MKRFSDSLGWLGVALVVGGRRSLRFTRPDMPQWSQRLALGRPRRHGALRAQPVARHRAARSRAGTSNTDRSPPRASCSCSAILVAINWISSRENKRWDLTAGRPVLAVGPDEEDPRRPQAAGHDPRVLHGAAPQEYRDRLSEYTYLSKQVSAEYIDAERNPVERAERRHHDGPDVRHRVRRPHREGDAARRAEHHERPEEGHRGQGQEDLLRAGPRRARPDRVRSGRLQRHRRRARRRDNFDVAEAHAGAGGQGARRRDG